jgi:hypothetical protein
MQKTFENLLQIGNYSIQSSQEQRAVKAQNFQERSAINSIALQYGVTPKEGDTIETITARAAPYASEKQRLELARTRAEINKLNSEASRALSSAESGGSLDGVSTDAIALAYMKNPNLIAEQLKGVKQTSDVINRVSEIEGSEVLERVKQLKAQGLNSDEVFERLKSERGNFYDQTNVIKVISSVQDIEKPKQKGVISKIGDFGGDLIIKAQNRQSTAQTAPVNPWEEAAKAFNSYKGPNIFSGF